MSKSRIVRVAIYGVVAAVSTVLMVLGYIEQIHVDQALILVGQLLGVTGAGVALANLTPENLVKVNFQATAVPIESEPAPWLTQDQ